MAKWNQESTAPERPLLLWPGGVLAVVAFVAFYVLPGLVPAAKLVGILGGLGASLLIVLWWLFLSRARWSERLALVALAAAAMAGTKLLLHVSVARGNMGFQYFGLAFPALCISFVVALAASRRLSPSRRRVVLALTVLLASSAWLLVRSKGVTSGGAPQLAWRWTETPEERLLASGGLAPSTVGAGGAVGAAPWPGLRGPNRDGVLHGTRVATDWARQPPVELWRRAIGPGVSSFAVGEELFYTQEQRGEEEIVAAYRLASGEPVWMHRDTARFWDAHVGPGPRATPALAGGRVYTLGATGRLNALDAATGAVLWSRDAALDADAKQPGWGFVGSPLVVGQLLIVQAGGLLAYDLESGEPKWRGPKGGSYSSPHLLTLDGVPQILLVGHRATVSVSPADGSLLWEHPWDGVGIVQPVLLPDGDLLLSLIDGGASPIGTRRIAVERDGASWRAEERWTSNQLKTSFSDVVVRGDQAYGVDGSILAAIDLDTGKRRWKGGRYGEAQLLLLAEQGLLLVLTEKGELALVEASPERFHELGKVPVISGKTWTQPALVGDLLLARNDQEMAAFRLPAEQR